MNSSQPPNLATKLLEWVVSGPHGDALAGDLAEQFQQGRSAIWYWRQVLSAVIVCMARDRTLGSQALTGSGLVLLLVAGSVLRHPASLGVGLFAGDIAILLGYGVFAVWAWRQRRAESRAALMAGGRAGVLIGCVLITSHLVESFVPAAYQTVQFVRGAGSVLLMLGLLGIAGSAAWERTRSARLAAIAGLWSGTVGMLMLVNFVLTLDFAFEAHATSVLNGAFLQSGMNDPGAFLVRNSLESILEIVTRLPIAATVLSFIGSLWNAWIKKQPRSIAALAAYVLPFMFLGGVLALWHIQSLPRVERPPFVIAGLLSACLALCAAHPIWSALSGNRSEPLIRQPGA